MLEVRNMGHRNCVGHLGIRWHLSPGSAWLYFNERKISHSSEAKVLLGKDDISPSSQGRPTKEVRLKFSGVHARERRDIGVETKDGP